MIQFSSIIILLAMALVQCIPEGGSVRNKLFGLRAGKPTTTVPPKIENSKNIDTQQKIKLMENYNDEEIKKELSEMLTHLDDQQLDELEMILAKDLDELTEFDLMMAELKGMGMSEEDIDYFYSIAQLMHEFLMKAPEITEKLDLQIQLDLLDNVHLYLLGLPNKLGPLGFLAFNHVLKTMSNVHQTMSNDHDEVEIVDVVIERIDEAVGKQMASNAKESNRRIDGLASKQIAGAAAKESNRRRRRSTEDGSKVEY